ncbi:unnamed protein product, partial [Musa banksii]
LLSRSHIVWLPLATEEAGGTERGARSSRPSPIIIAFDTSKPTTREGVRHVWNPRGARLRRYLARKEGKRLSLTRFVAIGRRIWSCLFVVRSIVYCLPNPICIYHFHVRFCTIFLTFMTSDIYTILRYC